MASAQQDRHRTYLLCPVCKKTQFSLPGHLRRKCMKDASDDDIVKTVEHAKVEGMKLLRQGRIWEYSQIRLIMDSPDPVGRMIKELQERGNVVMNIPQPDPAPATSAPTSGDSCAGPSADPCADLSAVHSPGSDSKEVTRKRFYILNKGCIPPHQCLAVLEAAKGDFLTVVGKLNMPQSIAEKAPSMAELQLVLYYLEAVVILRHLQLPAVVEHMTVEEWMLRKRVPDYVVVAVKENKTAGTKVASFALSQEEEMWFEVYYTEVRPLFLTKKRRHVSDDDDDEDSGKEKFFISSAGKSLYNASNDLSRLHDKYKLPKVTSQMARRSFDMSSKSLTDGEKSILADYLTATAERHARMRQPDNVVSALLILKRLGSASAGEDTSVTTPGCSYRDNQTAYDLLVQKHPVQIDVGPPKRAEHTALTKPHERYCYDRWRSEQLQLRVQHVLEHFGRRQPSEARVHRWVEMQGWTTNLPDAAQVVRQWKPSDAGQVDAALNSSVIQKMTRTQNWKGLLIIQTPDKGLGVVTTRTFSSGEVVCDYHGRVVSRQEGLQIHQATGDMDSGYMFFFKDSQGQAKCIDAHERECPCHPGMATFGRLINHSSKRHNLRPRLYTIEGRDVILFLALRDLKVNEELLFDYGVDRKSFAGEGLDLMWL